MTLPDSMPAAIPLAMLTPACCMDDGRLPSVCLMESERSDAATSAMLVKYRELLEAVT